MRTLKLCGKFSLRANPAPGGNTKRSSCQKDLYTDIAMVIGANDVVNPAGRTKKESPLYVLPILNVDYTSTVMVFKRSLNPGFAGEDKALFYEKNTMMVFRDAKTTITGLVQLLKK